MQHVRRLSLLFLLLLLLWWAVNEGDLRGLPVALPIVLLAALAGLALLPPRGRHWSFSGLLGFLPFFLVQSLRGGADVARRALHPRLPLAPSILRYEPLLPQGPARIFLTCVISLLPGTLSVRLREEELLVHVLDDPAGAAEKLRVLEQRIAGLYKRWQSTASCGDQAGSRT